MEKEKTRLLEHRTITKRRKPRFIRKEWNKISALGLRRKTKQKWRAPKGRHNKLREKKRGAGNLPTIGFGAPKAVKGMVAGLRPVLVHNIEELMLLKENEAAIIAKVGKKKRTKILEKAAELGKIVLNPKKTDKNDEKIKGKNA